tara:strand:+ start:193 stop:498 length:306 start_codon:yes stop_codon:yes gene_type:complete
MINGSFINVLSLPAKSRAEYQTHSAPICLQHCNLLANEKTHPPTERDKFYPCPRHGRADFTAKHKNPEKWTFVRFISKPALINSHDRSYISDFGRIQTHDT